MQKVNLTVGAFSVPFAEGFVEEDDQVVPKLKSLKRFAAILSDYGPFNLKFILPKEGQLGVLTETGYHDGVLGLMQENVSTVHVAINVKITVRLKHVMVIRAYALEFAQYSNTWILKWLLVFSLHSALISSLTSVQAIPLLLAVLTILILELIAVKHFKIEALLTAIFKSFGISFYQDLSHRSSWLCLIQMLILMFPVFIFNSAFSTQTIVGTTDYKVDTLKDVIEQGKIPRFLEGISMYDFFKGKVNKDYAEIYERAVAKGFGEPFPLGPITGVDRLDKMVTFVSGIGRKLAPLSRRMIQGGIFAKIEGDIYIDFILSFYPATLYDFHKSQAPRKGDDLNWKPVNYSGLVQIFHLLIFILILSIVVLLVELIIAFLTRSK
uniref:Uncharacterized protein n=1 Tax=Tetranychus urticae TaxID=32264 RepID=T1KM95_TETUR